MICRPYIVSSRWMPGLGLLLMAALLLSACGALEMGGARGTAVKQVRNYVELPEVTPELQKLYADLPTRVVFEYARAIHHQGLKLTYQSASVDAPDVTQTRVIVNIAQKTKQPVAEREYRLLVELEKDIKGAWRVTAMRALP